MYMYLYTYIVIDLSDIYPYLGWRCVLVRFFLPSIRKTLPSSSPMAKRRLDATYGFMHKFAEENKAKWIHTDPDIQQDAEAARESTHKAPDKGIRKSVYCILVCYRRCAYLTIVKAFYWMSICNTYLVVIVIECSCKSDNMCYRLLMCIEHEYIYAYIYIYIYIYFKMRV